MKKKNGTAILRMSLLIAGGIFLMGAVMYVLAVRYGKHSWTQPEELLSIYMDHITEQEYEEMYQMVDVEESGGISLEDFRQRNSSIYEGIEIQNIALKVLESDTEQLSVRYEMSFDTAAGPVSFENEAYFTEGEKGYRLIWTDGLIFPELESEDKVRVTTYPAERGQILDRNGNLLAGPGTAVSVGIVPGKLEDRDASISRAAELLEMDVETVEAKLSEGWVTEESFVPLRSLSKIQEVEAMAVDLREETRKEWERQQQLLEIPGILISDTEVRSYPLAEAASHLIGYVQAVTAEDLEEHEGEGYHTGSVIGRSGMESLYETELKGEDGCAIRILDSEGNVKRSVASKKQIDGETIRLTIDADLQKKLYEQFREDPGCSVAMNPVTGEVLALVSTPSYDNNDFILGMTDAAWTSLNEDEDRPLYNRFRQTWCPGSTFKPIIAGIGLKTGTLDPDEDFGNEGLSWQKGAAWGSYFVTTLHAYEPVVLKNALIYSDNIYFAKAALKIGAENLAVSLDDLGFNQEIPFEIRMTQSQYSNTDGIETEIQLADSGYGQGQILVNPLHLACLYTAFSNQGDVIQPYLRYSDEPHKEVWISQAFTPEQTDRILDGLKGVVNDPHGTGYRAHRNDMVLAGKTGTAELKASKEDTEGTEIGWFAAFPADPDTEQPVLIVSMVENVKHLGGSGYVVQKDSLVLDSLYPAD